MITKDEAQKIANLAINTYLYFESETDTAHPFDRAVESFNADMFGNQPTIVCLCGSTRFYQAFLEHNYRETMAGKIVLSVGFYPHAINEMHGEGVGITPEQKEALDQLHLEKVKMADEVLILNCDDYVGTSTARELAYARSLGKRVRWLITPSKHALISEL